MSASFISSRPHVSLLDEMRKLTAQAREFWIATAYVGDEVVSEVVEPASQAHVRVRLLTGTFGRQTRARTFRHLFRLQSKTAETRIWREGSRQDFHAKVYLWWFRDGSTVLWIGSANFTGPGLRRFGELVLEVRGNRQAVTFKRAVVAYEEEWKHGSALDRTFLRSYREAKHAVPDLQRVRGRGSRPSLRIRQSGRFFVTDAEGEVSKRTQQRVHELLGGETDSWLRHRTKLLANLEPNAQGLLVDMDYRDAALIQVTRTVPDGKSWVTAYETLRPRDAWVPWNAKVAKRLADAAGLRRGRRSLATSAVTTAQFQALASALHRRWWRSRGVEKASVRTR